MVDDDECFGFFVEGEADDEEEKYKEDSSFVFTSSPSSFLQNESRARVSFIKITNDCSRADAMTLMMVNLRSRPFDVAVVGVGVAGDDDDEEEGEANEGKRTQLDRSREHFRRE